MSPALTTELERTRALFASVGRPFPNGPGATPEQVRQLEQTTGIAVGPDLAALWSVMDGAGGEKVFAVRSDEVTSVNFLSTDRAAQFWRVSEDEAGASLPEQDPPRDSRIAHAAWTHPRWLPFAEFNEGSTTVYYDADPGPGGTIGQVIVFQHDPDGIYYVAEDIAAFVRASNNLLAADPEELIVEFRGV